jgi:UDP-2,3-diacylglucosamine pyrophosphatase LpxH
MTMYLEKFLTETNFDKLILNGDTIDSLNFKKFKPRHWRIISLLKKISLERKLVLIRGNHDEQTKKGNPPNDFDILPNILNTDFLDEYTLSNRQGNFLVLHGHKFDPTLNWPIITDVADWCYQTVQKINRDSAKWLKRQAKQLGGVIELLKNSSVKYAKTEGYVGVITGHTHYTEDSLVDGIRFVNGGSWVEHPCHYVLFDDDKCEVKEYPE